MRDKRATGPEGPLPAIAAFVAAALAVNALVFGMGGHRPRGTGRPPLVPPAPVVGVIWTCLFGLMGWAHWRAGVGATGPRPRGPLLLAATCLAFPFYAVRARSGGVVLGGTAATLVASLATIASLRKRAPAASRAIVPTAAWLGWVAGVGAVFGLR